MNKHQREKNELKRQKHLHKQLFNAYFLSLVHVPSANMEEEGLWPILQPATRGRSRSIFLYSNWLLIYIQKSNQKEDDLYYAQPPGGDWVILASLLGAVMSSIFIYSRYLGHAGTKKHLLCLFSFDDFDFKSPDVTEELWWDGESAGVVVRWWVSWCCGEMVSQLVLWWCDAPVKRFHLVSGLSVVWLSSGRHINLNSRPRGTSLHRRQPMETRPH